jgi:hypothetical protein
MFGVPDIFLSSFGTSHSCICLLFLFYPIRWLGTRVCVCVMFVGMMFRLGEARYTPASTQQSQRHDIKSMGGQDFAAGRWGTNTKVSRQACGMQKG